MKVAIMQPYFMPYLGYISLIKHTDRFILFDAVQFIRHGWIERNRTLKPDEGWQYIKVPLLKKSGRDTLIKDVMINNCTDWQAKIKAQLQHYKKKAPYFQKVIALLDTIFDREYNSIVELNKRSLECVLKYLNIDKSLEVYSEMNLEIEQVHSADEWALNICRALGCKEYVNPSGGVEIFDRSKYELKGVKLYFHSINCPEYSQGRDTEEAWLSIIDVLMFNSVERVNEMLDDFKLI